MRYGLVVLTALAISGCGFEKSRDSKIYDIADDVADAQAAPLRARLDDLERRVGEQDDEIARLKGALQIADIKIGAAEDRISKNARVSNENSIADMTRRGACGREVEQLANGGVVYRNRQCTEKDLR